jgi:hypothetical protein
MADVLILLYRNNNKTPPLNVTRVLLASACDG